MLTGLEAGPPTWSEDLSLHQPALWCWKGGVLLGKFWGISASANGSHDVVISTRLYAGASWDSK